MQINKYELALFIMIRNQILFTGQELKKNEDEINSMAADTMNEMMKVIDFERAQRIYARVSKKESCEKEIKEVKSLRWLALNFPFIKNPQNEGDKLCSCINIYCTAAADLIEKLAAENERLKEQLEEKIKSPIVAKQLNVENINLAHIETKAYKEFYEKLHAEILAARDSNFKAKEERIAKSKEYGIPIDVEDNFLMYCDGKIHALDEIDYFAYETYKEMVSEDK